MENIVISGGTGLVGNHLIPVLLEEGFQVTVLSRSKEKKEGDVQYVKWDPDNKELPDEVIANANHVINLAGANLGQKRWTESYKREIMNSRVLSTRLLVEKINELKPGLKTFVSASAINYYGLQREGTLTENDDPGNHFLSEVCVHWEEEANHLNLSGTKLVIPRISTILAKEDGALPQMARPITLGVGAPLGPGNQHTPWIHIRDLVKIFTEALKKDQIKGPVNAAAPESVTNKQMTQRIAKKLRKPLILPNVPIFALKTAIGEFAEVLLTDLDISVEKLRKAGFEFDFPVMEKALDHLLKH